MIERTTVLILGAGASIPYGFPSGYSLVKDICQGFESDSNWCQFFPSLIRAQMPSFVSALHKSGQMSIDSFLEHRIDFRKCGKNAIARALIPHEDPNKLFTKGGAGAWYEYFFKRMNTTLDKFAQNNITIITYNYDRSLEHFLVTALSNTHNRSMEECWKIVSKLKFIHVHGTLGPYQKPMVDSREYNNNLGEFEIFAASENINIIHEGNEDDPRLKEAILALKSAEKICFLGFGYDPLTVKRLKPETWSDSIRHVTGSCYGMSNLEISEASGLIPGFQISKADTEFDCLQMLRNRFRLE